jgi:hypothetical protein
MKFFLWISCIACLVAGNASGQTIKKYKVNPGQTISEAIPQNEIYSYPEFTSGRVYLRNNTVSLVKLNYNALLGEMQFINPNGDTLSVADEKLISLIVISTDTFFYDNAYLKMIANEGKVKLANNQFIEMTNKEKIGEFGQAGHGSIETYGKVSTSQSPPKDLVANEILTMTKKSVYYIGDEYNSFKVANKKNVLVMYVKNENEVKAYLKENKVDFNNEKDLKQLIIFLKKITPTMPI